MFQTLTNKSHKLFIYNLEQLQFYPLEGATGSAFRFHFRHMISPNAGSPLTLKINNQNFSETARNAKHDKLISLSGCKGDGKAGSFSSTHPHIPPSRPCLPGSLHPARVSVSTTALCVICSPCTITWSTSHINSCSFHSQPDNLSADYQEQNSILK